MGKIVLFTVLAVLIVIGFFIDDDDHTHRPHTGNIGDLW